MDKLSDVMEDLLRSKRIRDMAGGRKKKNSGMKIYTNSRSNPLTWHVEIVAEIIGVDIEVVMRSSEEWKGDEEHKK